MVGKKPSGPLHRVAAGKRPKNVQDVVDIASDYAWKLTLSIWDSKATSRFARILLLAELLFCAFLIKRVAYTEIDWKAYMDEVEGFLNGTLDYSLLQGSTGPLVYPAGFVYIFSGLYYLTGRGSEIPVGQAIFAGLYVVMLALVFRLYVKSQTVPPYVLMLMCALSFRIHSIFILRLFNDCVAMLLFFASANLMVDHRWPVACFLFSSAVSVKMNVLLFAPGLLFLLLQQGYRTTAIGLTICAAWQLVLAVPFLLVNPLAYIQRSFDLQRVFMYEWTVNLRFLPEKVFLDRRLHVSLLLLHVALLGLFLWRLWMPLKNAVRRKDAVGVQAKLLILFTSNLVGIACSRSLHYQFYVWYFHTLHFLLWSLPMRFVTRVLLLGMIEYGFNVYPSTNLSSGVLVVSHVLLLANLLWKANHLTSNLIGDVPRVKSN